MHLIELGIKNVFEYKSSINWLINEIISERGSINACNEIINVINSIGKKPLYYEYNDELHLYGEEEDSLQEMLMQRDLPAELVINAVGENEEILESIEKANQPDKDVKDVEDGDDTDPLLDEAIETVIDIGTASTSRKTYIR